MTNFKKFLKIFSITLCFCTLILLLAPDKSFVILKLKIRNRTLIEIY